MYWIMCFEDFRVCYFCIGYMRMNSVGIGWVRGCIDVVVDCFVIVKWRVIK